MIRDTSKEAYDSLTKLSDKQRSVLVAIKAIQPCTDYQLSLKLNWSINRITPRRGELETLGIIRDGGKVTGPSGRKAHVWLVKQSQGVQLKLL